MITDGDTPPEPPEESVIKDDIFVWVLIIIIAYVILQE